MDQFLGEIAIFGFNFPPKGWASCNGQLLSIQQNTALFSLIGTTFGGDGITNFALPNLQGRVPIHAGRGTGLSPYVLGQVGGGEGVTLNIAQMGSHVHSATCSNTPGNVANPGAAQWAASGAGDNAFSTEGAVGTMSANCIQPAGGNQPHTNLMPYLVLNFAIALVGIFPSRN